MKKRKILKSIVLMITILSVFTACGRQEQPGTSDRVSSEAASEEYVYVPEYLEELHIPDSFNWTETKVQGDRLYQYNYIYDLEARKGTDQFCIFSKEGELLLELSLGGNGSEGQHSSEHLRTYDVDAEGNVYTIEQGYGESSRDTGYYLCCYDKEGLKVFSRNITDSLKVDESGVDVSQMLLGQDGRIYILCQSSVKQFKADGSPAGSIPVAERSSLYGMVEGKSGDVYILYQDRSSVNSSAQGAKLDFKKGKLGEAFGNLPQGGSYRGYCAGDAGDFLINAGSKVYEYRIDTQTYEEVLNWLDCDIVQSNVDSIGRTKEGDLYAVISDLSALTTEVAFLRKHSASEVVPRTEIVLGLLYFDSDAQAAAVSFNRKNDKYRVVIRSYVDSSAGESYEDGLTKLSLHVAAGEGPDIFDLTQLDMEALSLSGAVEDLGPWLEGSSVLDREDYLENVLEGYTYGGKLAAIPYSFSLQTIAGKASELGDEMGWTLEEVFAYAAEHPQAKLFQGATKSRIIEFCMMCDMERFLDWDSGTVNFDSEVFVELLEFANSYPDVYTAQADSPDPPELLQSGEVLLYPHTLYYFDEIQLCPAIFDQSVTYVGYPTADGSANVILNCGTLYGISAASQNKEGAWTFIESWLNRPVELAWGFSPRRSQLELQIADAKEAKKDSNGKILTDEDGYPLPAHGESGLRFSLDGKEYNYHACTDEEIGWVEELLSVARPVKNSDSRVMAIIEEEVQAFYAGQKTAEEVAYTIQSRVQVYVDENR